MVRELADKMLAEAEEPERDAALRELERGRRRALRLVKDEAAT
jgi:hypothetical protein